MCKYRVETQCRFLVILNLSFPFQSAYVHQVVMDRVISSVNVSVMKAMLASSVTDVQTAFMAFQAAEVESEKGVSLQYKELI